MSEANLEDDEEETSSEIAAPANGNTALTLVVFSWCAWMVFQTVQLVRDRVHLNDLKASQEAALQEATKFKSQIDGITADTAKLAAAGNPAAQRIVLELRKRGFKVGGETKPAPPPATQPAK
ncbi:MAG: hypothetical protein EXR70_13110 [Deltaproteobacteria bacterium]|nr:hypothetical protein [Deltaproteobacteria bacterium]